MCHELIPLTDYRRGLWPPCVFPGEAWFAPRIQMGYAHFFKAPKVLSSLPRSGSSLVSAGPTAGWKRSPHFKKWGCHANMAYQGYLRYKHHRRWCGQEHEGEGPSYPLTRSVRTPREARCLVNKCWSVIQYGCRATRVWECKVNHG
jgi:hypothetical protein